jgi:Cu(I)-responsive transcriptional regulator
MPRSMNIGEAAAAAGVSAKMIRHYEQIGLMPAAARTDSGYRQYGERELSVLRFIRQSRGLGFSMQQIAELIGLWSDSRRASSSVKALAQQHVAALEEKMRAIAAMKHALDRLVASCNGDERSDCAILEELATDSPSPPDAGPLVSDRRSRATTTKSATRPTPVAPPAYRDLEAWSRSVRQSAEA